MTVALKKANILTKYLIIGPCLTNLCPLNSITDVFELVISQSVYLKGDVQSLRCDMLCNTQCTEQRQQLIRVVSGD